MDVKRGREILCSEKTVCRNSVTLGESEFKGIYVYSRVGEAPLADRLWCLVLNPIFNHSFP